MMDLVKGFFNYAKHGAKTASQLTRSAVSGRTHKLTSNLVGEEYNKELVTTGKNLSEINDIREEREGLLAIYNKDNQKVNVGDTLKVSGLDAVQSHYYKLKSGTNTSNAVFEFNDTKAMQDAGAVAAAAAAAVVGFKATQTGVSLLTGDY